VGTERPTFNLDAHLFVLDLDVVVQQLETRLLRDTHPYDAGSSKVRECTDSAKRHDQFTVPTRDPRDRRLDVVDAIVRLLAKEL
jgi:hypothetical protein